MNNKLQAIATLNWTDIDNVAQSTYLGEDLISIGRSKDNDIVILDKRISRYHAEITFDGEHHIITDLNSINGVILNDNRITENENLIDGIRIRIGPIQFTYEIFEDKKPDLLEQIRTTTIVVPEKKLLPYLEVISGRQAGVIFELEKDEIKIGRPGQREACDFVLYDRAISRTHTKITKERSQYFLSDLASANGTILNGKRIVEPILLKNGDIIEIGETVLILHLEN